MGAIDLSPLLPRHLAERVLEGRADLEGERKVVTVLFADLVGSTTLGAHLDPEDLVDLLNSLFARWIEAVHAYEGTVDKFLGDGMLALFGAPLVHEDDPRRAVLAALAIRDATRAQAAEARHALDVRIGLNTGAVIIGTVGSDARMEYTAIGDAVNVAQRIEATAEPGTILIGEDTRRLVAPYFAIRPLGAVELRGRGMAEVAEVTADLEVTVVARGVDGLASDLVGRSRELAALTDAMEAAGRGEGSVTCVVGEPGVGKSRLISELHRRAGGIRWAQGHALSFGATTPYLPIAELVGALTPDRDVNDLLAGTSDGDAATRDQVVAAVRRAVVAAAPAVLVIEDLHWADGASLDLLEVLSAGDLPVAIVVTTRPEGLEAAERLGARLVRLAALSPTEQVELVGNLVGNAESAARLEAIIGERCQGIPFYTEEYLREMIETGLLVAGEDGWQVASDRLPGLPATVQALVASRIDRLAGPVRRTLHAAAVLGRTFSLPLLAEILQDEPDVDSLVAGGFVLPGTKPEGFDFVHAITQEVAYGSMLRSTRRRLHLRAAAAIEAVYPDEVAVRAAELGRHYDLGDRADLAIPHLLVAARRSAAAYANDAALELAGRVVALTENPEVEFEAHSVRSEVLGHIGRRAEELAAVADLHRCAGDDGHRRLLAIEAEIRAGIGAGFLETYDLCQSALRESQDVDDPLLRGRLLEMWATFQMRQYSPARAVAPLDEAVALFAQAGAHRLRALALSRLGGALLLVDPERSREVGVEAMAAAREAGDPKLLGMAHHRVATTALAAGRLDEAIAGYAEVLELAGDIGDMTMLAEGYRLTGYATALAGDADEAEALLSTALDTTQRTGNTHGWLLSCMTMVEQWEARQRFGRLHTWLEEIEPEVAARDQSTTRSYIHYAFGYRTLRWFHAVEEAQERLRAALAIVGDSPDWMPPAVMYRNGLAMVQLAAGRHEEAGVLLGEARALVDEHQLDEVTGTYLLVTEALLGLAVGELGRVAGAVERLNGRLSETEFDEEHQATAVLAGELALAEGRSDDALAKAQRALATEPLTVNGRWFSDLHATGLLARATEASGERATEIWRAARRAADRQVAGMPSHYRQMAWNRPDLAAIRTATSS